VHERDAQEAGRLGRWYRTSLVGHPDAGDFRQLWVGDTISQFGTQVGLIALPLLAVTVLNADEFQMGLLATSETLAFLIIGLPAGAWVDRMRKRNVLVVADLMRGVLLLALPAAYLLDVLTFPMLLVVAATVGVATVFFDVAYQSYLPSLVSSDRISEGNARLQVSQSAAQVIGPGLGGGLARLFGAPLVILVDAVSFLGSLVFTLRIRHREEPADKAARRPLLTEIGEGLSFVVRQALLRRIVATTGLSNLFGNVGQAMLVYFAIRDLGLGEAGLGLTLSIGAVGGLTGALAAGHGQPVAIAMLATSMAVFGFGTVIYNVAQVSFRQRLCPRMLLGRMNASVRFIVWGSIPVGAFLGALIGGHYGASPALWVSVAGQLVAVVPVLFSPLRRMRDLPRALDQHAGTSS